ncbi:DUF3649 domain-containing protein [Stutzerimonas urumqiensis]|uniref:DUF3649 domain-containing protein n=1 Tax=Stutzerimonas urumqiensis TaxID=638269 RepID=UPI003CCC8140
MDMTLQTRRLSVASRVLAALVGGYGLAYGCTAFLSVYLPLARPDRVALAGLLCFAVWVVGALYAFGARSATRAWLVIGGLALLTGLCGFLPTELRTRP